MVAVYMRYLFSLSFLGDRKRAGGSSSLWRLRRASRGTGTVAQVWQSCVRQGTGDRMRGLLWTLICLPALAYGTETWDPHYISCEGFPDGYHEVGCWGKAVCVNGQPVVTKCRPDQMFDFASDSCVSRAQQVGSTSCNTQLDCSQESTGRHADLGDGCKSYHICLEGAFYGRMYCPPRTIFNEALQICDYPGHVPPPCGPYTSSYSSTPMGPWPEYTGVVG